MDMIKVGGRRRLRLLTGAHETSDAKLVVKRSIEKPNEPGVGAVLDGLLPVLPPPVAVIQDVVGAPRLKREPRPAHLLPPRR